MTSDIKLNLIVDDKGSKIVSGASGRMTKSLSKLGAGLGSIIKKFFSWKSVVVFLAGAAGLGLLIKKVTALSAAQELAEKKLEQAMRSTKMWNANLMESYKAFASELQGITAIGDEVILDVMAMLQTFKLQEGTLKDATKATLDLAKATGQDLRSAAILVGKAAVGEVSTLKRYGIIVDEAALKARGFQAVLDEINTEFGGQAQAQAETYAGKIAGMKGYWSDMLEKIGDFITKNPVVLAAIDKVSNKFKEWGQILEDNKDVIINWFADVSSIILRWLEAIEQKIAPVWRVISEIPAKLNAAGGISGILSGGIGAAQNIAPAGAASSGGYSSGDVNAIIKALEAGKTVSGGGTNIIISEKLSRSDVTNIISETNRTVYRDGVPTVTMPMSNVGAGN